MHRIESVDQLMDDYRVDIRPYYVLISAMVGEPLPALSNELRAICEHLRRCSDPSSSQDYRKRELEKASDHLVRFKLDVLKAILLLCEKRYEKLQESYRGVPVQNIDNKRFFSKIIPPFVESQKLCIQAKLDEPDNKAEAIKSYKASVDKLLKIDQYLDIVTCRMRRLKVEFYAKMIISFVLSVGLTITSCVIDVYVDWFIEIFCSIK